MKEQLRFLSSPRFWALVLGATLIYLKTKGYIGEAEMVMANTILGGFVIIKTTDRFAEKVGEK